MPVNEVNRELIKIYFEVNYRIIAIPFFIVCLLKKIFHKTFENKEWFDKILIRLLLYQLKTV